MVNPGWVNRAGGRGIRIPGAQFLPTLSLYTPVLMTKTFVMDLTKIALGWRRTTRLQGGYWQGTFRIEGPMSTLGDYFYNWLGYHLEEKVLGVTSWEGMIYEMVLNTPNASRVRSQDKLYNWCITKYIDGVGADGETASAYVQASINRYGRRETYLDVGDFGLLPANAMRDSYLAEHTWPWGRPQASGGSAEYSLDVTVCGYVFGSNFRHTTTVDNATGTVHDWISDIITDDCAEFLTDGTLAANTTSIKRTVQDHTRCWDLLQKLVRVGDASGNLYRIYVRKGRYIDYEQVSKTPDYYIVRGNISSRIEATEAINPWFVTPGIFRDMDYQVSYTEPGSYLDNVRDVIVEEVSCGANSGLTWQSLDFSESAQLAAFQELASEPAGPPGQGGRSGGRTITDSMLAKMGISRARWAKLTPGQRRKLKKKL